MNEHIQKLAEQQGLTGPNYFLSSQELEKFAELIVRECVSICKEKERANLYGVREVETTIKEHFGIKE